MYACFSCLSVWWSERRVQITLDCLEEIESPCNHPAKSGSGQHRLSLSPGVYFCLLYEWNGRCILIFQTCLPSVLSSFCRPVYLCYPWGSIPSWINATICHKWPHEFWEGRHTPDLEYFIFAYWDSIVAEKVVISGLAQKGTSWTKKENTPLPSLQHATVSFPFLFLPNAVTTYM